MPQLVPSSCVTAVPRQCVTVPPTGLPACPHPPHALVVMAHAALTSVCGVCGHAALYKHPPHALVGVAHAAPRRVDHRKGAAPPLHRAALLEAAQPHGRAADAQPPAAHALKLRLPAGAKKRRAQH